jgi:putative thiamine transport system ATP-binding protein
MDLFLDVHRLGSVQRCLLSNWQLRVPAGRVASLLGPSGCGKSALLAAAAGTLTQANASAAQRLHYAGRVLVGGRDVSQWPTHQRRIAWVPQEPLLFAHLDVAHNILLGCRLRDRAERDARLHAALAALDLHGLHAHDPARLSGGQRARVSLLRAVFSEPQVLLLDEPLAALDAPLRAKVRQWLCAYVQAQSLAAVLVTHDVADIPDPSLRYDFPYV